MGVSTLNSHELTVSSQKARWKIEDFSGQRGGSTGH